MKIQLKIFIKKKKKKTKKRRKGSWSHKICIKFFFFLSHEETWQLRLLGCFDVHLPNYRFINKQFINSFQCCISKIQTYPLIFKHYFVLQVQLLYLCSLFPVLELSMLHCCIYIYIYVFFRSGSYMVCAGDKRINLNCLFVFSLM